METIKDKTRKKQLEQAAADYKDRLEVDLHDGIAEVEKVIKSVLWVGGAAALTYAVLQMFQTKEPSDSKDQKSSRNDENKSAFGSFFTGIGKELIKTGGNMLAIFLLDLARKKLYEYIDNLSKLEEKENDFKNEG